LDGHHAILDGEVVALAACGRADFYSLFYRRAHPYFYACGLAAAGRTSVPYR
jgi:hypothetical protein